jgi:WD40 repeat protein
MYGGGRPFDYNLNVEGCDQTTSGAFADVLVSQQAAFASIASHNNTLRERVSTLQQENARLLNMIEQLKTDNTRLAAGGGPGDGGYAPPTYGTNTGPGGYAADAPRERYGAMTAGGDGGFVLKQKIRVHEGPVHAVAVGPKNDIIATGSWDTTVKLYNLENEEVEQTLGYQFANADQKEDERMGGLYAVAWAKTNPDILAATSADKAVYLWNTSSPASLSARLVGHQDEVNGVDFHPIQTVMATASDDTTCHIWDYQECITLRKLDKHTKQVYGVKFLGPEFQYLVATACFDQKIRCFDMRDRMIVSMMSRHADDIIGIDFSQQRPAIATGSDDGKICIWCVRTWKMQQEILTREEAGIDDNEVKRVAFSLDGGYLAAACSSQKVLVYDLNQPSAKLVAKLDGHDDCVFDVAWGVDPQTGKRMLVSASPDQTCQFWKETR